MMNYTHEFRSVSVDALGGFAVVGLVEAVLAHRDQLARRERLDERRQLRDPRLHLRRAAALGRARLVDQVPACATRR